MLPFVNPLYVAADTLVFPVEVIIALTACVITGMAATIWYSLRKPPVTTKSAVVIVTVSFLSFAGAAVSVAKLAADLTSQFWMRQSLLRRANHLYTLERIKSRGCPNATPSEAAWLDAQIIADEDEFKRPEIQNIIAADSNLRTLLTRIAKLQQRRGD